MSRSIAGRRRAAVVGLAAGVLLAGFAPSAGAKVSFERIEGFPAAGTPAKYNKVGILKVGSPRAKNVLVLNPGTSASAAYFAPAGAHRRPAGSGLAGVGGQPAREPPRGSLGGQLGQDGQGQRTATVRLLPRLPHRSGGHRSLHGGAGLGGPVRAGVGHARECRGPAPRGQEGPAARRRGRRGRPFARRFHHHRLRHLGFQRPRGRQRVGRPRLHRRRQQPRTRHPRAGDPIAPGTRRRIPLAGLRRYQRALRRPVQHRAVRPWPASSPTLPRRCRTGLCCPAI